MKTKYQSNFVRDKNAIMNTYNRIPIEIFRGEGVYLFSKDGKRYLDFFSGLAVNALGYNHPGINEAISEQLNKFIHLSNFYVSEAQIELAELLLKHSKMFSVFFSNSGTESVEAALKIVRKVKGSEKKVISFTNSFHGRTYGAMSISGKKKYKQAFSPLLSGVYQIKFNDAKELLNSVDDQTGAVFLEFIQGEGGINIVSNKFVDSLKILKEKYDFTIVADEIQSGIGRTGKPFAFNHFEIEPDIVLIAKALGGGLPLGAVLVNQQYAEVFSSGDHGSTFGGNPLACSAGLVVLKEILENKLFEQVFELGEYFVAELRILMDKYPAKIKEVRGKGFLIGVEMKIPCKEIIEQLRNKQVLVNCTNYNVVRILPPLISQKKNIDFFLFNFEEILSKE